MTDLEKLKEERYTEIERKTEELCRAGASYSSLTFGVDNRARIDWTALLAAHTAGLLTLPTVVIAQDDTSHSLSNTEELLSFMATVMSFYSGLVSSGGTLKQQIKDAATEEAVNLVIDNR